MAFFSRTKEATEPARPDDVPFESLRRSPRPTRKGRASLTADAEAPPPLDPTEAARTRARRRLIGAVALGLAAIVFVPMLFDRTQGPVADDIAVQIPDRNTPFEGRRGVPESERAPLKSSAELPSSSSAAAPAAPIPAPVTPAAPASGPAATASPATDETPPDSAPHAVEKPAEKTASKAVVDKPAVEKPAEVAKSADKDDPRALAALEGKPLPPADGATAKGFAVQIAAFSSPDRARGLRDQLTGNGLKAYTESLSTPQGQRTRVRLGPFTSRESADRAKQKLRTMKLDGSVVAL